MKTLRSLLPILAGAASLAAQDCSNLGTPLGNGDETVFPIQPIGFAFPIGGTTYTDVHVTTNGHMYLSNAGVPAPGAADFTATVAELGSGSPRVAPLWNDLNMMPANNGMVYIENSSGTVCTVTWKNAQNYNGALSGGPLFDIQAKLFPNGDVQFFYSPNTTNNSTQPTWAVGICGVTPGLGATLPAASNLSAGGATADATLFEDWQTPLTFDLANNSLYLVAQNPGYAFATAGPQTNCGSVTTFGTGCVRQYASFYENFASAASFDLSNSALTLTSTGAGYVVSGGGTYNPVGSLGAPTPLALTDDSQIAAGTLGLTVGSNGWVATGTGNSNAFTPSVATLLGNPATAYYCWHDYNPAAAGSGLVQYEESGTQAQVTFDGVYNFGGTSAAAANFLQFQIDTATGNVVIAWQTMSAAGNAFLVGYSPGGPNTDPGNSNLSDVRLGMSALQTFATDAPPPLSLSASAPLLGPGWTLTTTNIDAISPISITFFGTGPIAIPGGLPLTAIGLPAPGCSVWINTILGDGSAPNAAGTSTLLLPLPNNPAFVGASLSAQSLCLTLLTPANLLTSNAVLGTVGY